MKVLMIAVLFAVTSTAMAGTSVFVAGTIKSVDVDNNTFTVQLDDSGITKTYSFPDLISFAQKRLTLIDKSAFKPGQSVKLNLEAESSRFSNSVAGAKKEYTLKSMTVD